VPLTFLYVSNDSGSVSGFVINSNTGALTPIAGSPWATGSLSRYVRADIAGNFLYVSNTGSGSISIFSINQTSGALTQITGSPVNVVFNIYELQIEPLNKFAYVGSLGNGIYGFSINSTTGMLTPLPGFPVVGGNRGRMGVDPTGNYLYSSNQDTNNLDAFQIDPNTGSLSQFASFPAGTFPNSIGICSTKPATTSALSSSLNPSSWGQSVPFTATVTPQSGSTTPTGTVTFKDGGVTIGSVSLDNSGQANFSTSSLTAGSHSITAIYGGDTTYATSTSPAVAQTVSKAATTTTLDSSPNPSTVGQTVNFVASVTEQYGGAATGTVTFMEGANKVVGTPSLANGSPTLPLSSLGAGSHTVTAAYGGDANSNGSTSSAISQNVVSKTATTTTLSSSFNPSYVGSRSRLRRR
jgi:Bacterial Ig-like domain (group 3)/Lactonase, 7-bladed beta-propeller